MINLGSNRRRVLAGEIILLSAIMLMTACGNESYQVQDLRSLPRQAVSERIYRTPVILSTDTLNYDWGLVLSARKDAAGNIYVQDRSAQAVLKFDSEGRFLTQLGKKGPGPGEFSNIRDFDVRRDGTMFAYDAAGMNISVFDPKGQFIRKGAAGAMGSVLAVNDDHFVRFYSFGEEVFESISDVLKTRFKFGRLVEDPIVHSAKILGLLDGFSGGTIHVSLYTGIIFGFDLQGRQTIGIRTIDPPNLELVRWEDGSLKGADGSTFLINVSEANIYIGSSSYQDVFGIDVYSTKTGEYEFSFPLANQTCGPRYIDVHEMISACTDGEVLRQKIRFE